MKIGVIGLGNMGAPMAERLIASGHDVTVYNRTRQKVDPILSKGAYAAATPAEAVENSEVVFTMLSDDVAVKDVVYGKNGIIKALPKGGVHISSSTISIEFSEKLEEMHTQNGQYLVSAPIMGRPDAIENGDIRLIIAGDKMGREKAWPIFESLSKELFVIGDQSFLANVCKLGNNFLLVSMLEALSEVMMFVGECEVDRGVYINIVNAFFRSPIYKSYSKMMVEENFRPAGFKMELGQKDTNLVRSAAKRMGIRMPLADLVSEHFEYGINQGCNDMDW